MEPSPKTKKALRPGKNNLTFALWKRNQLREENSTFIRKGRGKKEGTYIKKRKRGKKEEKKIVENT